MIVSPAVDQRYSLGNVADKEGIDSDKIIRCRGLLDPETAEVLRGYEYRNVPMKRARVGSDYITSGVPDYYLDSVPVTEHNLFYNSPVYPCRK